jgi:hypothetical protein
MNELWKNAVGYAGYAVSDRGRVMNLSTGEVLTGTVLSGRRRYLLTVAGKKVSVGAGRLVALTFIGPAASRHIVAYKNGDSDDNRAENLKWVPRTRSFRGFSPPGESVPLDDETYPKAKLTPATVQKMRKRFRQGARYKQLAAEFGVSVPSTHKAVHGRTWKHVPGAIPLPSDAGWSVGGRSVSKNSPPDQSD